MNTPLSWIKAYVPELQCTEQEYMDAMTMSGTKVEGYEKFDKNLDKIIVGKIEKIEKHPDADKLVVCQVAIDEKNIEKANLNIQKAQKIIVQLRVSLDTKYPVSQEFDKVYDYIYRRLVEANMKKDNEILEEALKHIKTMRETWIEVMKKTHSM